MGKTTLPIPLVNTYRDTFAVAGSHSWTVPNGVNKIKVTMFGAGGGAGTFSGDAQIGVYNEFDSSLSSWTFSPWGAPGGTWTSPGDGNMTTLSYKGTDYYAYGGSAGPTTVFDRKDIRNFAEIDSVAISGYGGGYSWSSGGTLMGQGGIGPGYTIYYDISYTTPDGYGEIYDKVTAGMQPGKDAQPEIFILDVTPGAIVSMSIGAYATNSYFGNARDGGVVIEYVK
jgi:hypothetical protein